MFVKISPADLLKLTDAKHQRNMYAHPNPLARDIFWQRLDHGCRLISDIPESARVLDFGGGSGAFLPSLSKRFSNVSVVDLDLDDARHIAKHYQLKNVNLYEEDITNWNPPEPFELVVAMDVLEHFEDMMVPLLFLNQHLKKNGYLLVSLPTENWIYQMGRFVLRKTKPVDHYHPAQNLVRFYQESGFTLQRFRYAPRFGPLFVPLFFIGLFLKSS